VTTVLTILRKINWPTFSLF